MTRICICDPKPTNESEVNQNCPVHGFGRTLETSSPAETASTPGEWETCDSGLSIDGGKSVIHMGNSFAQLILDSHNAALAELRQQLAHKQKLIEILCKDWADDDTAIKDLCKPFGVNIEGDGYSFMSMIDCVEQLAAKLAAAQAAGKAKDEALEHCRQRPHEHNPSPDWIGPTRCDVIDRALAIQP